MRSFILFSILFLVSVSLSTSTGHGNSCTTFQECLVPGVVTGLICNKNQCVCPVGQIWDKGQCKEFSLSKCNYNIDCQDVDSNRTCNKTTNRCVCKNFTYENTFGWCVSAYNSTCQVDANCCGLTCNQIVSNGTNPFASKCGCPVGKMFINRTMECIDFHYASCYSDSACQDADPNRICRRTDCICNSRTHENTTTKWCQIQKGHNETCEFSKQCQGLMVCKQFSWNNKRCRCPVGYQWSNTIKNCVSFSFASCTKDIDCQDSDSKRICVNSTTIIIKNQATINSRTCACPPGYFQNSTWYCTLGANRGEYCFWALDCKDNMTCDGSNQCKCKLGYVYTNAIENGKVVKKCVPFNKGDCILDSDCQDQDDKFQCRLSSCECKSGYELRQGKCYAKLYKPCTYDWDCPIYGSVCNKDLKRNQCTCKQTHYLTSDGTCHPRTCYSSINCYSSDFTEDNRMMCSLGNCECKNIMGSNGYCVKPIDYDYSYSSGMSWWLIFIPIAIILSVITAISRMIRWSYLASERRHVEVCAQPASVAIVSSSYSHSSNYVNGNQPPKYGEDLPPSYSRSVNGK